ncbi:expressed unknown protein [Seminavis robusta]|uniref:Uncharacterized protein n=1 Tax=Seminavis robusta TaxID=568900 RepID=A0A9N8EFV2_9STRA|nr:expressed unknown protein [Seminavis robusta]|eukprot:Sro1125_g243990.1 n/a (393) ;mRNA; r:32506-33684
MDVAKMPLGINILLNAKQQTMLSSGGATEKMVKVMDSVVEVIKEANREAMGKDCVAVNEKECAVKVVSEKKCEEALTERVWTNAQVQEHIIEASKAPAARSASAADLSKAITLRRKIELGEVVALDDKLYTDGICAAPNCNKKAHTKKHISWCKEHEKALVKNSASDFDSEMKKWPKWLQEWVKELRGLQLNEEECHGLLYSFVPPMLLLLEKHSGHSRTSAKLFDAIATYKKHYNPIPAVASFLLTCALTFIISCLVAIILAVAVAIIQKILEFVANAAEIIVLLLVHQVGWRAPECVSSMLAGGLVGAGVGASVSGAAATLLVPAGVGASVAAASVLATAEAGAAATLLVPAGAAAAFLVPPGALLGTAGALVGAGVGLGYYLFNADYRR